VKARRLAIQADRVHFLNTKETRRQIRLEAAHGAEVHVCDRERATIQITWSGTKFRQRRWTQLGCFNRSETMNIFYIIGVVVVIIVVAGFLGLHV
jgi:hypothetical protein